MSDTNAALDQIEGTLLRNFLQTTETFAHINRRITQGRETARTLRLTRYPGHTLDHSRYDISVADHSDDVAHGSPPEAVVEVWSF